MMRAGALCLFVLLTACGGGDGRYYYTLTYPMQPTRFAEPLAYTVRVKDVAVRDTYRNTELVFRPDLHEIRFYKTRRWSERPQKMVTDLVRDHLRTSGLFQAVTTDLGQAPPDFTFTGEVEAIEELDTPEGRFARLAMTLKLVRFEDDRAVWSYRFDRRRPVGDGSVRATVRVQSEMLAREMDRALEDLARHLSGAPAPPPVEPVAPVEAARVDDPVIRPSVTSPLNDLPQFLEDETPVSVGFGAIFVPALSDGEREPLVVVYRDGKPMAEGYPGRRIVVQPDTYTVRFGSGAVEQQLELAVAVEESRTTIVPPTWSGLEVEVVDEKFVPFRGTYELIRMDNREDYGIGFGADELLGEQTRTWILRPGLYKLIRAGGTYRDRTDFATIRLLPGDMTNFTLVQNPTTGELKGAGEVDPSEAALAEASPWTLRAVVGGDIAFGFDDGRAAAADGWSLGLRLFLDASLTYYDERHQWITRFDLEEGQERDPATEEFFNEADRLFLHTIYTYRLLSWFGPYARAGLETSLLADYRQPGPDGNVGTPDDGTGPDVKLRGAFEPLELIEGVGGNFQVVRSRWFELDLRAGLGARQTFQDGVLLVNDEGLDDPLEDTQRFGPEGALLAQARISRWVALSSELDGLVPIGNSENTEFSLRNQVSVRLTSFASLTYRYILLRKPTSDEESATSQEHDLQLRFSYTLF